MKNGMIEQVSQIEELIRTCRLQMIDENEFYKRLVTKTQPFEFKWCASLYHLSKHYVEILRMRHERFHDVDHDVFNKHYLEEVGHAQMLRDWMLRLGLPDPEYSTPTPETDTFISVLYRAALEMDQNMSLLILNSTAEGFALDLYTQCLSRLQALEFTSLDYWEVHCVADQEHSEVYHLLSDMDDQEKETAVFQVRNTLEIINRMISSWI
jgi:Iron-containing redox enzyme